MSRLFPPAGDPGKFEGVRRDDRQLRAGVRAVCEALGLDQGAVVRFPDGSLPVYAIDDSLVLKLYPPFDLAERDTEAAVLSALAGKLPVPTPEVRAVGDLDGWGYLLMDRVHGESLVTAWPSIPEQNRLRLAADLGRALARLHAIECPQLDSVRIDWPAFLARQRRTAVERQARRGLGEPWLGQVAEFLDRTPLGDPPADSLLHTEIMREHLLVQRGRQGWRLSGLFDVEPAMVGAPEYEFASVGLFFSCGDSRVLSHVLLGYGYHPQDLGPELARRFMAYALLHRYSDLPWWLERMPAPPGVTTLDALASRWWGTEPSSD